MKCCKISTSGFVHAASCEVVNRSSEAFAPMGDWDADPFTITETEQEPEVYNDPAPVAAEESYNQISDDDSDDDCDDE